MGYVQAIFPDGRVLTFGDMPDEYPRPAAVSGLRRNDDCPVFRRACEMAKSGGKRTTLREIKTIARRFRDHPKFLNGIYPGLAGTPASDLIRYVRPECRKAAGEPISRTDLIMSVRAKNLRAAWIVGRYWRRFEWRQYGALRHG